MKKTSPGSKILFIFIGNIHFLGSQNTKLYLQKQSQRSVWLKRAIKKERIPPLHDVEAQKTAHLPRISWPWCLDFGLIDRMGSCLTTRRTALFTRRRDSYGCPRITANRQTED